MQSTRAGEGPGWATGPSVILVTDRRRCAGPMVDALARACAAGGKRLAVYLREPDMGLRRRLALAETVRDITRRTGSRLIVGDRLDLARWLDADGLHLTHRGPPLARVRPWWSGLLSMACHDVRDVRAAARGAADMVLVSPVFPTASKPGKTRWLGPEGLAQAATAADRMAVFALGGIGPDRVKCVMDHGAHGVAVMGAILAAPDPDSATTDLLTAIDQAG